MNRFRLLLPLFALLFASWTRAASVGELYLRHLYGDPTTDISAICWPNDDLWMLAGRKNAAGLAEIAESKISHDRDEVFWENIQNGLCIVEVRDGKVDPRFLLEQIRLQHRELILRFIYAALTADAESMRRLTTDPAKVKLAPEKAPPGGDLDVYQEVIALLPVVRVSPPADDKVSHSVSYRLPLGKDGFLVRLVKKEGGWLVDTTHRIDVPLEFFFK